jgi:hypothetical protein
MLVQDITSSPGCKLELRIAKITLHCIYAAKFWIENNINMFFISNNNFVRFRQVILAPKCREIHFKDPEVCKKCWMCYNKKRYEGPVQHLWQCGANDQNKYVMHTATSVDPAWPHFTEHSSACPLVILMVTGNNQK